ncbi:MAG: dihydrofolate reductase family protein [Candidatus Dormiibacterota bacterium]
MASELVVDLFVSVDGWAGSDGLPGYFGYFGPDLEEWNNAQRVQPEVVVMGRRTYESFQALPEEAWAETRNDLMATATVVVTRTLKRVAWPNTRILDNLHDIGVLKAESDVRLRTWGSMSLARQLLSAKLVDRLRLMTFPLFAGEAGRKAAFADMASADLRLTDHRVLDGRILLTEYQPTGNDIPRA